MSDEQQPQPTDQEEAITEQPADPETQEEKVPAANEEDAADTKTSTCKIVGICFGVCIFVIGIILLVLGLLGYLSFEEPCIGGGPVEAVDVQVGGEEESSGGGGLGGLLGAATGNNLLGAVTSVTNSLMGEQHAELIVTMNMEANNTNPYDLDYEQGSHDGIVLIPANETGLAEDLRVGNFTFEPGTLEGGSAGYVPLTLVSVFDFSKPELAGYTASLVTGGPIVLRIVGGIDGKAWVPVRGVVNFVCAVEIANVLKVTSPEDATVRCAQQVNVGGLELTKNFEKLVSDFERDSACYV